MRRKLDEKGGDSHGDEGKVPTRKGERQTRAEIGGGQTPSPLDARAAAASLRLW